MVAAMTYVTVHQVQVRSYRSLIRAQPQDIVAKSICFGLTDSIDFEKFVWISWACSSQSGKCSVMEHNKGGNLQPLSLSRTPLPDSRGQDFTRRGQLHWFNGSGRAFGGSFLRLGGS